MRNFVGLLIVLLLLIGVKPAMTCTCIGKQTVKEAVKEADAVFVGIVLSENMIDLADPVSTIPFAGKSDQKTDHFRNRYVKCYMFLVHSVCKGYITGGIVSVFTGIGGGDCGVKFETGRKFIVFGSKESYLGEENDNFKYAESSNIFWTNSCTLTAIYNAEIIKEVKKYSNKPRGFMEKSEVFVDQASTEVEFTNMIKISDATSDGIYMNGYVVCLPYHELVKMNGKSVRVSGIVTVAKVVDTIIDGKGLNGREVETRFILNPKVIVF